MAILTQLEDVKRVLQESRAVAVLGANVKEHKAAYYVPAYLAEAGFALYPVNPVYVGRSLFGQPFVAKPQDVTVPIDVVEVFRRSEHLPEHVADILAMKPLPKVVWFQLGIRYDEVAKKFSEAGLDVIQDRCMLADHQQLFQ